MQRHQILFIHSSVDRYLSCFHFWAIVNNATMNGGVQIPVQVCPFYSFGYVPRTQIAGWYGSSICNQTVFPQRLHDFTFPPAMHKGSNFSTSSSILVISNVGGITAILVGVKWYLTAVTYFWQWSISNSTEERQRSKPMVLEQLDIHALKQEPPSKPHTLHKLAHDRSQTST